MTNATLIINADTIVTMDDDQTELKDSAILCEDGIITAIGSAAQLRENIPPNTDTLNAAGCIITPGLINTHHHLFQTLTRCVPDGIDAPLFDWLKSLYPIFARYTPDDFFLSAQIGLAELALSGCTLSSDHLYLFPNGARLDDTIHAAQTIGLRFHATRGAMSIGESKGGLPPDCLVEDESTILKDTIRVIDEFHCDKPGAMVQIAAAPCSPFSVSQGLMRDTAELARDKGVRLHTHLAENDQDIAYSLEKFGLRPGDYVRDLGWVGDDVWHAHCVKLNTDEINLFAGTNTGVAHCPCSNGRLGSGIAPIRKMLDADVNVGLGVDGSASNDSNHLLMEARQSLLMQRAANGATAFSTREALRLATRGGASILGRNDVGVLATGKRADFAIWDLSSLEFAGAWDRVAALVLCGPTKPRHVYVEGKAIVSDWTLTNLEIANLYEAAETAIHRLAQN